MEFARIPCSRPSIASCRVIPIIPALAVVCASEPSVSKLMRPLRDAVFTMTPWLAFRCGHAARVRKNTRSISSRRSRFHSSSVMSSKPVEVRHGGVVEQHVDPAVGAYGELDQRLTVGRFGQIAWLHGAHRSAVGADHCSGGSRGGDVYIAADDRGILVSECQGGGAADAPVGPRDDANLLRKPARHLGMLPVPHGLPLGFADTNVGLQLLDFGEIPIDDLARFAGQR